MKSIRTLWTLLAAFMLLLGACSAPGTSTQPQEGLTPAASPTHTTAASPIATQTATQQPERVILVAPDNSDPALTASTAAGLTALAAADGLVFEQVSTLSTAPANTRIVVFLNPGPEIKDLAGNTPDVQFVAIGALDLQPLSANLNQILIQPEQTAFLAGFIGALAAPDWRVGGLVLDTPATLQDAFLNGGRYHCGRCAPQYAPIVLFPVVSALPAGSDAASGWNAFKKLDENLLEVIYVDPVLASPELLAQLAGEGIGLIGSGAPSDDLRPQWIASVRADSLSALQALWPDLLAAKGGSSTFAPLVVDEVNPDWLSEGRLRLVEETAQGLQDGTISPVVPPGQ